VIVVITIIVIFIVRKKIGFISHVDLPPDIAWSFEEAKSKGNTTENFHMKLLEKDGKSFTKVTDLFFNNLGGDGIIISEIYAVYSKDLVTAFCIYRNNMEKRLETAPHMFQNENWKKNDLDGLRQWVHDQFCIMCQNYHGIAT